MRTVKWNPVLSGVCAFLGGALLWIGAAGADVTTTNPSAILVFPSIKVDTTSANETLDTVVQLTNTADQPVNVRCFYVNANGHCSNAPFAVCNPTNPLDSLSNSCDSGYCVPGWVETDFFFRLTAKQPIVWTLSKGLLSLPLDSPACPTTTNVNCGSIPPAPEDPMIGELKCVQVGDDERPVDRNDLKGEATIERISVHENDGVSVEGDSRGYNAIGIQAVAGGNNRDDVLQLDGEEYNACPNLLVLDHFFDYAIEPAREDQVFTELTFVPCSEDFVLQVPVSNVVQFLVYNEFEQRFSTSRKVTCVTEIPISDIDTRQGPSDDFASIFSVNVQGTLTGQTIMRGVTGNNPRYGNGILVVANEIHVGEDGDDGHEAHTAAFHPVHRGQRLTPDAIYMPAPEVQ